MIETKKDKGGINMNRTKKNFSIKVDNTDALCPIGEAVGKQMLAEGIIPVISCEGSCIRGEIARVAANMLAKEDGYGRGCHGEIFTVPHSAIAEWTKKAEKIIVIDGCFLHCHGRIMKNLFDEKKLAIFDALSFYNKYTDLMNIDDVPENERRASARQVMDKVLEATQGITSSVCSASNESSCCK
jgi:uncharacterized metal-binding protein